MESAELAPGEVAALLAGVCGAMQAELGALPEAVASWHPGPSEWCVKEALGHLIEAERRGFAGRIRIILESDDPQFIGWDPPEVARARGDCDRDLAALVAEFADLRAGSVALVEGLRDTDLARGGHHPQVGYLRIGDLLHEWVHHDRNYAWQMLANVR